MSTEYEAGYSRGYLDGRREERALASDHFQRQTAYLQKHIELMARQLAEIDLMAPRIIVMTKEQSAACDSGSRGCAHMFDITTDVYGQSAQRCVKCGVTGQQLYEQGINIGMTASRSIHDDQA